jgi:hypothetical protein
VIAPEAVAPETATVAAPEARAPESAPAGPIHDALWAAAALVSEGASTNVPPPSPVAPSPLPLIDLPPTPDPVPLVPKPAPESKFPAFMTELRNAPDSVQWAVFGGTAAFLGVIWVAIWLAVGR